MACGSSFIGSPNRNSGRRRPEACSFRGGCSHRTEQGTGSGGRPVRTLRDRIDGGTAVGASP